MSDTVIKVEGLHKKFCQSLKRSLLYGTIDAAKSMFGLAIENIDLRKKEFWALKDINFELKRGETLGLIGQNGSGKTTLLRLINGIFPPDIGKITIKGRVGALIAVGAGFHPHMTGRENIWLNGTILGMTKSELKQKFDEIIDFAEIGEFIDAPVATYSSGMIVRLGFAIAIHCEPEILLIDEILAVGDINFQKKCFEKMNEIQKNGTSILFVSHSVSNHERICKNGILMKNGQQIFYGTIREVIKEYYNEIDEQNFNKLINGKFTVGVNNFIVENAIVYEENGDINKPCITFNKNIIIEIDYKFIDKEDKKYQLRVTIRNYDGRDIQKFVFQEIKFADNVEYINEKRIKFEQNGKFKIRIIDVKLVPQIYYVDVAACPMDMDYHEGGLANAATFRIIEQVTPRLYFGGGEAITEFDYELI